MAKFCINCGKPLPEGAAFCPQCGKPVPAQDAAPPEIPAPGDARATVYDTPPTASKAAPSPEKAGNPPSAKGQGKRGLSFFLSLVLIIELAVAGFKYPGFLLPRKVDPTKYLITPKPTAASVQSTAQPTALPVQATAVPTAPPATDAPAVPEQPAQQTPQTAVGGVEPTLRYTAAQIADAPAQTADVSWQGPEAVCGNVKVQLDYWNLDAANDQLTVRELPELSEGENGWRLKGYDLSLASGQKTFSGYVPVTIPRTAGDGLGRCVWYNEEADAWEDIYYEVSGDGQSYTLYTDHFSLFAEEYVFDVATLSLKTSDGKKLKLDGGVFTELYRAQSDSDDMLWSVVVDYSKLFNLFTKQTIEDARDYANRLKYLTDSTQSIADARAVLAFADSASNIVGFSGAAGSTNTLLNEFFKISSAVGNTIGLADITLTTIKVIAEAKSGNMEYSKAIGSSLANHKADIASGILSLIGLGVSTSTPVGWWLALAGLTLYVGNLAYQSATTRTWVDAKTNPTLEELYRAYYYQNGVRLDFGSQVVSENCETNYMFALMNPLPSMDEEKFEKFAKDVNVNGLSIGIKQTNPVTGACTWIYPGWEEAFTSLFMLYSDEPEMIETLVDELYLQFAMAFWNVPKDVQNQYIRSTVLGNTSEFVRNGMPDVVGKDRVKLTNALVTDLKVGTLNLLKSMQDKLLIKGCQTLMDQICHQLIPVLNTQLVFRVKDRSLPESASFQKSVYCVDWQSIPENKAYLPENANASTRYDSPNLFTPMRFADVTGPQFLPGLPGNTENRLENYYPYTPCFLPRANDHDDEVFRCTLYHYLMMGAPTEMIFRDVRSPYGPDASKEVRVIFKVPEIDLKDAGAGKEIDVYIPIPDQRQGATYEGLRVVEGSDTTELFTSAMYGKILSFGKDGRFSLSGSGETSDSTPRTPISYLGDGNWESSSRRATLQFNLSGIYSPFTDDKKCTLTGSMRKTNTRTTETTYMGRSKTDVYTTTDDDTFTGTTGYLGVRETDEGEIFYIHFSYEMGEQDVIKQQLTVTGTTTYESTVNPTSVTEGSTGWWIELQFLKVE